MRVWLLHPAEPAPLDGDVRLFRYGVLSKLLAAQGHEAVQWFSTFNHFAKTQRADGPVSTEVEPGYRVELLPGRAYQRHVGWQRIQSQRDVAAAFRKRCQALPAPDVILCSLPTLELGSAVLDYAEGIGAPTIIDVRDLWPDVFLTAAPRILRPLAAPLLWGYERQAQDICRRATRLTAVSADYLDWGLKKAGRAALPGERPFHLAYQKPTLTDAERRQFAAKWESQGLGERRALRCCFFGMLGQSAGLEAIASAAQACRAAGDEDIEFLICGKGPREAELQQLIAGLPNARYLGWVDSREIVWIMERSDVGIAAYADGVLQSLPNKPIEYLAGGLPVLTTLQGPLAALLEEYNCGASFRPQQSQDMAAWLSVLKRDEGRRHGMSRQARQLFASQFDAAQVYQDFIAFLEGQTKPASRRAAA
jgi:glycosyltransferase involved in cell wall biosynthesis